MFSWLKSNADKSPEVYDSVVHGLKSVYKRKLLPLEQTYKFEDFHRPLLGDGDFDAKPMILLVGQYSVGKTTFIQYVLESEFPGARVGPEPTTDGFMAIMSGDGNQIIPGNALVVDPKRQFQGLSEMGNNFLNRFQGSIMNHPVLNNLTLIDTPGILSGEKQRVNRGYDFGKVIEWFAERVDRIILLFDAHKLDISDEFKRVIECLHGYEDKIRIVLNKADAVDSQQLMRVYGALMWALGKVINTPEVARVYIGSFWNHALVYDTNRKLFELEEHDLFQDLQTLPKNAALRKLNDLIKRARLAKVHAYIIGHLQKNIPMFGKDKYKSQQIKDLKKTFDLLSQQHHISIGDFPDVAKMQQKLEFHDWTRFQAFKPKMIEVVDSMLKEDITKLMHLVGKEQDSTINVQPSLKGGAFEVFDDNPFELDASEGINAGKFSAEWIVDKNRLEADNAFNQLNPIDGKITGAAAKQDMIQSKLPNTVLGKIWKLADVDQDGLLDADEFALARYLIKLRLNNVELPNVLPDHLIPPSKR